MNRVVLFITFCWVLCLCGKEAAESIFDVKDPDIYRNVSELITSKGFPVEEHTVQTEDSYILSVQRIPYGRNGNLQGYERKTVLLIHGLLNNANSWVINFPDQSLGFVLPDEGYDVWLFNARGNDYSRKHVQYTTDQYKFWNFSFHEMGQYDIPATIDYILKVTGKEALYMVAYSQGVPASAAMLSERPDYNDKLKLLIFLAPAAFVGHISSAVRYVVPVQNVFLFVNDLFTHGEVISDSPLTRIIRAHFCIMDDPELCENFLFALVGADRAQLNETRLDVYASLLPASSSSKCLTHYGQLVMSKKFRKFDYGRRRNLKYYQQEEPPDYDLSRITTPVAVFWSENDPQADPKDVDIFRKNLNSVVFDYRVPYPYNHFDFVLAKNAFSLIDEPILRLLEQY